MSVDTDGRRSGMDRRVLSDAFYHPERRSGNDRRCGADRRSGFDRRNPKGFRAMIGLDRRIRCRCIH